MGHEAACKVMVTEVRLKGASIPAAYAKLSISSASDDLPDGLYDVSFPGYAGKVKKHNGNWLPKW